MPGCFCPFLHLFSSLLLPSCCPPVRPAVYHRAKERSCTAFTSTLLSVFMDKTMYCGFFWLRSFMSAGCQLSLKIGFIYLEWAWNKPQQLIQLLYGPSTLLSGRDWLQTYQLSAKIVGVLCSPKTQKSVSITAHPVPSSKISQAFWRGNKGGTNFQVSVQKYIIPTPLCSHRAKKRL